MTAHISQLAADTTNRTIHDKWLLCLAVALAASMAACWPDGLMHLRYDRSGLMDGEVWRVVTAHLVHLNRLHLLLNLLGLLLICDLQWGALPLRHAVGLLGFSGMAASASLWWLHPELVWYAGLSSVLHGLWAGCVLFGLRPAPGIPLRPRLPYLAGAFLLAVKLLMEFRYGASENTAHLIGSGVVTAAHFYGALAGTVYVLTWGCVRVHATSQGTLQRQ